MESLLNLSFYLNKCDLAETMTRTTITMIIFTFWKVHFSKICCICKSPPRRTTTFFFLNFYFPNKHQRGKKKGQFLLSKPGFAEEIVILTTSISTCSSQKSHTQHSKLSFVSTLGFNMRGNISTNGGPAHINPLAVSDRADPTEDTCWTAERIVSQLSSTAWLMSFHFSLLCSENQWL